MKEVARINLKTKSDLFLDFKDRFASIREIDGKLHIYEGNSDKEYSHDLYDNMEKILTELNRYYYVFNVEYLVDKVFSLNDFIKEKVNQKAKKEGIVIDDFILDEIVRDIERQVNIKIHKELRDLESLVEYYSE